MDLGSEMGPPPTSRESEVVLRGYGFQKLQCLRRRGGGGGGGEAEFVHENLEKPGLSSCLK